MQNETDIYFQILKKQNDRISRILPFFSVQKVSDFLCVSRPTAKKILSGDRPLLECERLKIVDLLK